MEHHLQVGFTCPDCEFEEKIESKNKVKTTTTGENIITSGFIQTGAPQGWQCPVCQRVLSPWTQECPCEGKGKIYPSSTPYQPYTYCNTTTITNNSEEDQSGDNTNRG